MRTIWLLLSPFLIVVCFAGRLSLLCSALSTNLEGQDPEDEDMEGTKAPGATERHRESIRLCKDRVVKLNSKVILGRF